MVSVNFSAAANQALIDTQIDDQDKEDTAPTIAEANGGSGDEQNSTGERCDDALAACDTAADVTACPTTNDVGDATPAATSVAAATTPPFTSQPAG